MPIKMNPLVPGYTLDTRNNRTARNRPIQSGQVGIELPRGRYGDGHRGFFFALMEAGFALVRHRTDLHRR